MLPFLILCLSGNENIGIQPKRQYARAARKKQGTVGENHAQLIHNCSV